MLFLPDLPVFYAVDTDKYEKNISLPNLANEVLMLEQYYSTTELQHYSSTTKITGKPQ